MKLLINDPRRDFNGHGGAFYVWISKNNQPFGARNATTITKGLRDSDYIIYDTNMIYLEKGDKINIRFTTVNTGDMNENTDDIIIYRKDSYR